MYYVLYNLIYILKGRDFMTMPARRNKNFTDTISNECNNNSSIYDELLQGYESMKNGEVYTIEEAWEEIDKI